MIASVSTTSILGRFTLDGDDALERHLEETCERVTSGIKGLIPSNKLDAILLGGGYGRGEGGVLKSASGDRPYNDLEFYVAIKGNRHLNEIRYGRRLQVLGDILTHQADVEVEFKITSLAEIRRQPISMFSYDLVMGHRAVFGSGLQSEGYQHHRRAEDIPLSEAVRLLMNRCSGLLFSKVELESDPLPAAAADFVGRNVAKAQMACGDALLAAEGYYHWSCRERQNRLALLADSGVLPWSRDLLRHHAAGVMFKLHPSFVLKSREELSGSLQEVSHLAKDCWLRLEETRLSRTFPSIRAYAEFTGDKCPETKPVRNALTNLRNRSPLRGRVSLFRHPRQRVMNALAVLLWEQGAIDDPSLRAMLERDLSVQISTFRQAVAAYRRLWQRVR